MFITHAAQTPNGALAYHHRVQAIEIRNGHAVASLNSYADSPDQPILWQWRVDLPQGIDFGADPETAVLNWLVGQGGIMDGGSVQQSPSELEAAKAIAWAKVKYRRDMIAYGTATTIYGPVDTDSEGRININGAVTAAKIAHDADEPFTIEWTMADNSVIVLDADGMIEMGLAALAHVSACHDHSRALRAAILAAESIEELQDIVIETGWPA